MTGFDEIKIYKQKMTQARLRKNWKAFNDLKKHYDKLIKESRKVNAKAIV